MYSDIAQRCHDWYKAKKSVPFIYHGAIVSMYLDLHNQ